MSLRRFGHSWRDVDEFTNEERGGKRDDTFRDCYPDLKLETRQFVFEECSKKEASFTAESLAKFVDHRSYELNDIKKVDQRLIRSTGSCRLDLRCFDAKFTANAARPYFLKHEREDVLKDLEEFLKSFPQNEHNFYTTTVDFVPR